ncbi:MULTISPECIES: PrsW family intramembrane metalloprotease [unclassified Luteococcus]|uniref:PrsW family intramembrane metalloprotease n=1 Tax=unclassified Luteococcus TaxID=2639923 RepID=UPI00313AE152
MDTQTRTGTAWTLGGSLDAASAVKPERRARSLSGLPPKPRPGRHWAIRILTSPWTWLSAVLFPLYALVLWLVWRQLSADKVLPEGTIPGLDWQTVQQCARYAAPTALVWSLGFILFDRLRPMKPLLWLLAFGWGSCMSIWLSLNINSWAAEMLNVSASAGDPAAQARPAVFVAPFVEEASKATILFLLAILIRYRIVSVLQSVGLAGLSAIGFAFTENIVYYARAMVYGSVTIGAGDVEEAVKQLVFLRGVITSYGHPMFTMFTGIGLLVGLRTRSKLVRVLAPLTGFCLAALGHMAFNGMATVGQQSPTWLVIQFGIILFLMLSFLVRHQFKELKRIRSRLTDYVQIGWLPARDVHNFGTARARSRLILVALTRGWRTLRDTVAIIRAATELAYLRDAMVRGLIDVAGHEREKELLAELKGLRATALHETQGLKIRINWARLAFWKHLRGGARQPQLAPARVIHQPAQQNWRPPGA